MKYILKSNHAVTCEAELTSPCTLKLLAKVPDSSDHDFYNSYWPEWLFHQVWEPAPAEPHPFIEWLSTASMTLARTVPHGRKLGDVAAKYVADNPPPDPPPDPRQPAGWRPVKADLNAILDAAQTIRIIQWQATSEHTVVEWKAERKECDDAWNRLNQAHARLWHTLVDAKQPADGFRIQHGDIADELEFWAKQTQATQGWTEHDNMLRCAAAEIRRLRRDNADSAAIDKSLIDNLRRDNTALRGQVAEYKEASRLKAAELLEVMRERDEHIAARRQIADAMEPGHDLMVSEIIERIKGLQEQVSHWKVKAKCYGDMVNGCSPALEAAGHPVDAFGPDGAVGGIKRAVEALVKDRDAWKSEALTKAKP